MKPDTCIFCINSWAVIACCCVLPPVWAAPPQAAIDACVGLNQDEACEFQAPDGMLTGTCSVVEGGLACVPTNGSTDPDSVEFGSLIGPTHNYLPDTGQSRCYDSGGSLTPCPSAGARFYGQDAQYQGHGPSYTDHGDGSVSDNVTGLMWQQSSDRNEDGEINASDKLGYANALNYCDNLNLAGHDDWWLPTIKQMYSLIDFDGKDISGDSSELVPFLDTEYFAFGYGDTSAGERLIDAQFATSTRYNATTMGGAETLFGVNLADGRIKGYPISSHGQDKLFYLMCARGNREYGQNRFTDNGDGSVTDSAAGLTWAQDDSGMAMNWEDALAWAQQQNALNYLGHDDWRLPNAKELQSLVDYTRSPDATDSPAIDPLFNATPIINEAGQTDYPFYWTATTHLSVGPVSGGNAVYISFGRATGYMNGAWIDVHGAGAQRSDPKDGARDDYPRAHGPQGDAQRVFNYVRLVRDAGQSVAEPSFDPATGLLILPAVEVSGLGVYQATLKFAGLDSRYAPGFVFELIGVLPSDGAASASYNAQSGELSLPVVQAGGHHYAAELIGLPEVASPRFVVTRLE